MSIHYEKEVKNGLISRTLRIVIPKSIDKIFGAAHLKVAIMSTVIDLFKKTGIN